MTEKLANIAGDDLTEDLSDEKQNEETRNELSDEMNDDWVTGDRTNTPVRSCTAGDHGEKGSE